MTATDGRPLVAPSPLTEGFWAAARDERLVVQRCRECARLRHYPQPRCPGCLSPHWIWEQMSGGGVIYSLTVTHRAFGPAWTERVPYAIATIELDEGIRMISDLPAEDTEAAVIGCRVQVFFEHGAGVSLPRFRLARDAQQ